MNLFMTTCVCASFIGVVGGLLLPVLGAVPDAMIIVVSAVLAGTHEERQTQVAVGVGTLAGSTIMLLTIPYGIGMILARTDIIGGEAVDQINTKPITAIHQTGITVDDDTKVNARIMIATSLSYLLVQGVAFAYLSSPEDGQKLEDKFALAGFVVCAILLCLYSFYQVWNPKLQEKKMDEAKRAHMQRTAVIRMKQALEKQMDGQALRFGDAGGSALSKSGLLYNGQGGTSLNTTEKTPLLSSSYDMRATFDEPADIPQYSDRELEDVHVDIREVGLYWRSKAIKDVAKMEKGDSVQVTVGDDDDDDKEEENHDEQELGEGEAKKIAIKAAILLSIGTAIVVIFSDPMVDVIGDFGISTGIPAFYVSFVVTPFCSNASELISSLIFASKKKRKNSSLT